MVWFRCAYCRAENLVEKLEIKKIDGAKGLTGFACDTCKTWNAVMRTSPGLENMMKKLSAMRASHKSFPYLFRKAYARAKRMQER